MSLTLTTPNMNLAVPVVGTQTGPQYATDINNCFTVIDQHDHSSGKGVQISSAGIEITADFVLNNYNLTNVKSLRLQAQPAALGGASDLDCFYVTGVDAYFNDGNGNQIRLTQSGGIAGSQGNIAGLTSPAAATYVSGNQTFVWQSDSNIAADMDCGSVIFRNLTASSNGITVSAPSALASNYTIVWPTLPASQKFLTLDASGNMAAPWAVDNSTIEVATNTVQVKDSGITGAKLNSNVVDNSTLQYTSSQLSIKDQGVTAAKILNATITGTQVSSNINLPGTAVSINSKHLIASQTNATKNLVIIRASFDASANLTAGEGATASKNSTGNYTVSFTTSFGDTPVITTDVDTTSAASNIFTSIRSVTSSNVAVLVQTGGGSLSDCAFHIIAIGQQQ